MLSSSDNDITKKKYSLFFLSNNFFHTLSPAGVIIHTVQGPLSLKITGGVEWTWLNTRTVNRFSSSSLEEWSIIFFFIV